MSKISYLFIILTLAASYLSSCSSVNDAANQGALVVEEKVLVAAAASLSWEFPKQLEVADDPPGVIYRESQLVMAGAENAVEIIRYSTEDESLAAFDALGGMVADDFHAMAATATSTSQNCKSSSTDYITDLAITDIYPGNTPQGQFLVRVTNHGPVACQNVSITSLNCAAAATPKSGQVGTAEIANVPVTLNIKPGETQTIPTGLGLDLDKAKYLVTCSFGLQGIAHNDLNMNNHYYQENVP